MELDQPQIQQRRTTGRVAATPTSKPNVKSIPPRRRHDAYGRTDAGNAPQVLAALRNTALTLVRRLGFKPAEGFEHFAENRNAAIETMVTQRTE